MSDIVPSTAEEGSGNSSSGMEAISQCDSPNVNYSSTTLTQTFITQPQESRNETESQSVVPTSSSEPSPDIEICNRRVSTQELLHQKAIDQGNLSIDEISSDSQIEEVINKGISPIIGARGRTKRSVDSVNNVTSPINRRTTQNSNESIIITPRLPTNRTLESQRQNKIIIIKPTGTNSRQLITNPIEIINSIRNSSFNHQEVKDIRVNKRKGILTAELASPNPPLLEKLRQVQKLGTWDVVCKQPGTDSSYCGVIHPLSESVPVEELRQLINSDPGNRIVEKIERLYKRSENKWIPSASLKLTFSGTGEVDRVVIGNSYYRVRPFVPEPVRCFKCQRLYHTSEGCSSKERCLLCGGNHYKDQCTVSEEQHKCCNCGGNHRANSKLCKHIKQAYDIEKIKSNTNCSHQEARNQYLTKVYHKQSSSQHNGPSQEPASGMPAQFGPIPNIGPDGSSKRMRPEQRSYANALLNINTEPRIKPKYTTIGTQTEKHLTEQEIGLHIMEKLGACLVEILTQLGVGKPSGVQKETITGIVHKHLGTARKPQNNVVNIEEAAPNEEAAAYEEAAANGIALPKGKRPAESSPSSSESDEDGVISDDCTGTTIFKTVEKKQVRVAPVKDGQKKTSSEKQAHKPRKRKKRNKKNHA